MNNTKYQQINFEIQHMDPMGQGVDKSKDKVMFVPKTLPGEKGTACITKKSKGVLFAKPLNIDEVSAQRVDPICPHFNQCPGCHYLHTDYECECDFKLNALWRTLKPLKVELESINLIKAKNRLAYRNRIQLHYRDHQLGMIDAATDEIVEVPECKIIHPNLKESFNDLYQNKKSKKKKKQQGHVELYDKDSEVIESWDKPYAEGGFSQVNEEMNTELKRLVYEYTIENKSKRILDLFSGYGNLTESLMSSECERRLVDMSPAPKNLSEYKQLNLFKKESLSEFMKKESNLNFETMIVDPPRKGFPLLKEWVNAIQPHQLIYVSCKAATMTRDLKEIIDDYKIVDVALIDLFPSNYHFESAINLVKR